MSKKILLSIAIVLGFSGAVHSSTNERVECVPQKAVATKPFMSGRYGTTHYPGDVLPINFSEASNTIINFNNNTITMMNGSVRTGGPVPITRPILSNNLYNFKFAIRNNPLGSIKFELDKDSWNLLAKYEYYDLFSQCRKF